MWIQFLLNLCLKKGVLLFQFMKYYFSKCTKIYQNETVSLKDTEIEHEDLISPSNKN